MSKFAYLEGIFNTKFEIVKQDKCHKKTVVPATDDSYYVIPRPVINQSSAKGECVCNEIRKKKYHSLHLSMYTILNSC